MLLLKRDGEALKTADRTPHGLADAISIHGGREPRNDVRPSSDDIRRAPGKVLIIEDPYARDAAL